MRGPSSKTISRAASLLTLLAGSAAHGGLAGAASLPAADDVGALVAKAEIEADAGRHREAWELFARAWSAAPGDARPARGLCRLALRLPWQTANLQSTAHAVCEAALLRGGTPEDMRNDVVATLMGPAAPTMAALQQASFTADGAVRIAGREPWGYGARAALALWLGDRQTLDASLADATRVAPEHRETKRIAAAAAPRASALVWAGRLFVFLVFLATATRAIARRWRERAAAATGVVALLLALAGNATAATPSVDEDPEAAVARAAQKGDPLALSGLLMELTSKAEAATKAGEYARAARYWAAAAQAVPERAYAYGRLCEALAAEGRNEPALAACRAAITKQGSTATDYTRFVQLLLATDGPVTASARRQIGVAIDQLAKEPRAALITERVRCDVAAHEHDKEMLGACTAKLLAAAPDDWRTSSFAWTLAVETGDAAAAARWLDETRRAGAPADLLARMAQRTPPAPVSAPSLRAARIARALRWGISGALATLIAFAAYAGASAARAAARRGRT